MKEDLITLVVGILAVLTYMWATGKLDLSDKSAEKVRKQSVKKQISKITGKTNSTKFTGVLEKEDGQRNY